MVRIARGAICRVEKLAPRRTINVRLWKFFISSANFVGLEWRKKRSGSKRNYMKPRWLAVSSRPCTKPTRSQLQRMGSASSQW
jgi:hypothetical protein